MKFSDTKGCFGNDGEKLFTRAQEKNSSHFQPIASHFY